MIARACYCGPDGQCDNCAEAEAAQEAEDHALAFLGGEPAGPWRFSHCHACAENDDGADPHDPGVGCPADGPSDGCEAVWTLD